MYGTKVNVVSILACIALLVGSSITAMAEEQSDAIICNEQLLQQNEQMEMCALPENVGDTVIIGEDANGMLSVTLVDYSESNTRSTSKTSKATYKFTYETFLGIKKDAFEVNLACDWIQDGLNSKIVELRGSAQELGGGYSCEWTDSGNDSTCIYWLELTVAKSGTYRFIATLFPDVDNPTLSFGYMGV